MSKKLIAGYLNHELAARSLDEANHCSPSHRVRCVVAIFSWQNLGDFLTTSKCQKKRRLIIQLFYFERLSEVLNVKIVDKNTSFLQKINVYIHHLHYWYFEEGVFLRKSSTCHWTSDILLPPKLSERDAAVSSSMQTIWENFHGSQHQQISRVKFPSVFWGFWWLKVHWVSMGNLSQKFNLHGDLFGEVTTWLTARMAVHRLASALLMLKPIRI